MFLFTPIFLKKGIHTFAKCVRTTLVSQILVYWFWILEVNKILQSLLIVGIEASLYFLLHFLFVSLRTTSTFSPYGTK